MICLVLQDIRTHVPRNFRTAPSFIVSNLSRVNAFRFATIVGDMATAGLRSLLLLGALGWVGLAGWAQENSKEPASQTTASLVNDADGARRPLPDIPALMQEVASNQKTEEAIRKDYLYHEVQTARESDGHGGIKKTTTREFDVFWVSGVPVWRMTKKDGKGLSPDEQKKQSERIDKQVTKAKERRAKAEAQGKDTDPRGHEEITASRILELGSFTNARRVKLNGRDAIAVDYAGDPKAKTRNRAEGVVRDLVGTVWVDEEDRMLVKAEGHFVNTFKIGAGLVVNIQKGTSFAMQMRKVNGEVWLPEKMSGHGAMRALLFFSFDGEGEIVDSDYRKFKATSTILPGMSMPATE